MDRESKMIALGIAATVITVGGAYLLSRFLSGARGTVQPGEVPVTALPGAPPTRDPCRALFVYDFHLRPREQAGWEGSTNYPRGTEGVILQAGTLRRNGALMYKVRILRDNREGWAYVLPSELAGDCRGASEADVAARAAQSAPPART